MAGKGSGWKNESRRHSLARKGVKTNIDQGKRFDVSNFVARGEGLSKKLDDLDGLVYERFIIIEEDLKGFIRYKDEWVEYIQTELSKMGYDEGDIDDMNIEGWTIRLLLDYIDDRLDVQTGQEVDDLSVWIEDYTGEKIDTDDITELIYNSVILLDPEFNSIVRVRDGLEVDVERELSKLGFDEGQIEDIYIEDWASQRLLDEIEDEIGWQRLFSRTDTLESWIRDRIRIRDESQFKSSGKRKDIDLPQSNLYLKGFGMDRNGNKVIKLTYPNGRGFSIQTNMNLPIIHSMKLGNKDLQNLTKSELKAIESEVIDYIEGYGSKGQQDRLRKFR